MNFKYNIIAILAIISLSACSTMTPTTYSPNADNNVALKKLTNAKVIVSSMRDDSKFDAGCRLMGPIEASNNRSVSTFVQDSLNDEFKFAGVYSDAPDATKLEATMEKIKFSSSKGLTSGWWDLRVKLKNPQNGQEVVSEIHYDFKSGFDAMTACTQTAQAMTPAVQQLIKGVVTNPNFQNMITPKAAQ